MIVITMVGVFLLLLIWLDPPRPRPLPRDDSLIQRVMRGDL
jgi:hypothetical protein